jgi:hypothetical protein
LGLLLLETEKKEALKHLQKSVMLNINFREGWIEIVKVLNDRGLYWLSERILVDRFDVKNDFGVGTLYVQTQLFQGRKTEALAFLDGMKPDGKEGLRMYAMNLFDSGCHKQSFELLLSIIDGYPENREFKRFLGHSLLRTGDYDAGWRYYWEGLLPSTLEIPEWEGQPLSGKSLVVIQDQGQGDAIQFLSLLSKVAQLGSKRMVFAVDAIALIKLIQFQNVPYEVVNIDKIDWDDYKYDYQVKIMALPFLLKVDMIKAPPQQPTLRAPKNLVSKWSERIDSDIALMVGIAWSGGALLGHDYLRSSPLIAWRELWGISGISFYSLQKDIPSNEAAIFEYPLNNIAADCSTWLHTLSVIESLDMVITVDTAIAHASASLNKPTWILLSDRYTDFRWMQEREDCPWYPSVRLFRKKPNETWEAVLLRVREALIKTYPQLVFPAH